MESIKGCEKTIKIQKKIKCPSCRGSRAEPGTIASKCYTCGGSGILTLKDGFEQADMICDKCDGYGKIVKHRCKNCDG